MAANDPGTYVDTPGGKMTALAGFKWTGSAWTSGGTPAPAAYVDTPGGRMLAGALFTWNGAAWVAQGV